MTCWAGAIRRSRATDHGRGRIDPSAYQTGPDPADSGQCPANPSVYTIAPMLRPLFAIVMLLAALGASDAVELKEVRAVQAEALKASDLWTALQCEAFAVDNKLGKLSESLPGAQIFGDPLFATPNPIITLRDVGSQVVVVTSRRIHRFRPDGRPLGPSTALPRAHWNAGISFDGAWAGIANIESTAKAGTVLLTTVASAGGRAGANGSATIETTSLQLHDGCVVANDGSAIAIGLHDGLRQRRGVQVCVGEDMHWVDNAVRALAIGAKGSWLLIGDGDGTALLVEEQRRRVSDWANGPGWIAIVEPGKGVSLVGPTGQLQPLQPPADLGNNPELATVGTWLLVQNRGGAKRVPGDDPASDRQQGDQPATTWCWRWADLIAKPNAAPAFAFTHQLAVDTSRYATCFLWNASSQVRLLDLSEDQPGVTTLGAPFAAPISGVRAESGRTRVEMGPVTAFLDAAGQVLWQGPGQARMVAPPWVLRSDGEGSKTKYQIVLANADAAQRTVVDLRLPEGSYNFWNFHADPSRQRLRGGSATMQIDVDALTGEVTNRFDNGEPQRGHLPFSWFAGVDGRFTFQGSHGRFFLKQQTAELPLDRRINPRDAALIEGRLVMVGSDEHVVITGVRKGELVDLGVVIGVDGFRVRKDDTFIADGDTGLATVAAGRLVTANVPKAGLEGYPEGPWQVNYLNFVSSGNGGSLRWDEKRAGFLPERLRSPRIDRKNLLVITSSCVIVLNHDHAKDVGVKR